MSLLEQLRCLIVNKDIAVAPIPVGNRNTDFVRNFIFSRTSEQQRNLIISGILVGLSFYILLPSISIPFLPDNKQKMFSKRPDKYTTGLINLRNDCFANSSLQAYLALPKLTEYLNEFITAFHQLKKLMEANGINSELQINSHDESKGSSKFKANNSKFEIPLHYALSKMMKSLQETRMSSRTISVWTFLHALENIFNAKISKSQHDAQELTQLINETLENENVKILKKLKQLRRQISNNSSLLNELDAIQLPEFPFSGLILSQMKCLSCSFVSKPNFSPFLMLTLNAPQKTATELETIIDENESESIEGYQCLKCRLIKITENENHLKEIAKSNNNEEEEKILNTLFDLNNDEKLCINDDLSPELEEYIKSYNKYGLDISKVTSTVFRRQQILKPPKVFGIHLSRSSFNGVDVTRNPCRVSFKDHLTLSIGKDYHEELKQFQSAANEESISEDANFSSNVLTNDIDDMEDEEYQREDIDENGNEDEENEETSTTDNGDNTTSDNEFDDDDDSDNSSLTSNETSHTTPTIRGSTKYKQSDAASSSTTLRTPETLNNAPITEDQTDKLRKHFRSFKFNDNDIYKYKLRALIKHQGSHSQGHYECYKRKPLYVKDKDGVIFKLSPEIMDDITGDITCDVAGISAPDPTFRDEERNASLNNVKEDSSSETGTRRKKFSFSFSNNRRGSVASSASDNADPTSKSSDETPNLKNINEDDFEDSGSGFRRKLSTMMGRRPSVFQADPSNANIQEIIHSGLNTPAELLVDGPEVDYFSSFGGGPQKTIPEVKEQKKVKMRKIPSLIKHPFWRISDSQITEVSRSTVLWENASVYMLYYERVDRGQIKGDK
ncbi:uncharacterized protein AC631_04442 [Debaryomyces fabryi]|uniref:USP domain-containing protein n=1 Tax=Debaryomyces fabryi TaxID=58627 RepID=A0A0V1PUQ1_9ASCO|nr:uncharacterized protein AC631_04442 [Debaryomyces fabryi]KRZ99787.1 hypothetical protein AC631_04442 [Debaryomyces fabryi]CUM56413.1 unnamed protein product [Debaryomyces fabryi]